MIRTNGFSRTELSSDICYFDRFLFKDECRAILGELDVAFWQPSLTYQKQADGSYRNVLSAFRISKTAQQQWFSDELKAKLFVIEDRLLSLFNVERDYLEDWQATHYARGGKFDYHLDAGYWSAHYAGERIRTFLLYLTTPTKGGGTHFRALDINVEAKSGRLLTWNNLFPNGDCNHRMIHSGAPVEEGKKIILVTWQRQKPFNRYER